MKLKKILKIATIIFIIFIICIIVINILEKIYLNNYINNSIKYFKDINYTTKINLTINNNVQKSNISYLLDKTSFVTYENYKQYINDELKNNTINYYVKKENNIKLYTKKNSNYESIDVDKINSIFTINYNYLKEKSKNIRYIKSDNRYIKYKVDMKVYDIYNLLYNKDILSKKDNDNLVKVYIYIDKKTNLIYKIESKINNINNSEYDINKLDYNIEIINDDFNNNKTINLPFNY